MIHFSFLEGSYFLNCFEFLLLSEMEAAVCQSQLIFIDSPFIRLIFRFYIRI